MKEWETSAAAAAISLAIYELWNAWQHTAPSLAELRDCNNSHDELANVKARQQLLDATFTVGSLGVLVGIGMLVLTRNGTVLILMLISLFALSYWYHAVLEAPPQR